MPTPHPALISKTTFIERTKVIGRTRSKELQTIDRLLGEHELNRHLGLSSTIKAVKQAVDNWIAKEGPNWKTSRRNSNGAIQELLLKLAPGGIPATPMQADAAHARMGVLFLFSNITVESNAFKLAVDGGFDLASKALEITAVGDALGETRKEILGQTFSAAPTIVGHDAVQQVAQRGVSALKTRVAGGTLVVPAMIPPAPPVPPRSLSQRARGLWEAFKELLTTFAQRLVAEKRAEIEQTMLDARVRYSGNAIAKMKAGFEDLWDPLTGLIDTLVGKLAVNAAPFVSGAIATASGIKQLGEGIWTRYKSYAAGKGVVLNMGHPAVIADAIHRAMNINIAKGMYSTMKGAGSLAMAAASFGGSAIVDLLLAGIEVIVGFVHRLFETRRINAFCLDCKERWSSRSEPSGIHNDAEVFAKWYRSTAMSVPAVAALTLTSGLAGDKMQYLRMMNGDGEILSQQAFDRGVTYVDDLKQWSVDYLSAVGYSFNSNDAMIASIIKRSTSTSFVPLTTLESPVWHNASLNNSAAPARLPSMLAMGGHR